MKEQIKKIIEGAVKKLPAHLMPGAPFIRVQETSNKQFGDYTAVIHFLKENPAQSIFDKRSCEWIINNIKKSPLFKSVDLKAPFINFFISEKYLQEQLKVVLKEKAKFGNSKIGKGQKINVEFISANPTGPLTLGNGRGGFGGDVLSNVLEKAGYKVTREYYINDTGNQIKALGHSVLGDAEAVYKGEYIDGLRKKIISKDLERVGEEAGKIILGKMIKPSVKKMGIKFDKWFSEKTLYKSKAVDKAIAELTKKNFTYKSEGALWFRSKDLGDDKDRVLIRADGIKTYFSSDIAYLQNKFQRGSEKLIIFLGADHYGYVARLKAACQALGFNEKNIDALVLQLVKLFENGKEVRMSKRTGLYVTIDELIDEVGLDVARFFFLQRSLNTHFNFDMDLAKEKSEKNPVFKVQYAYARINSIFAKAEIKTTQRAPRTKNLYLLKEPSEMELAKQIIRLKEVVDDTARDYQLQRLPAYSLELADSFHKFYENCKVISEDKNLTSARLSLIMSAKIALENILELMGVSAPKEMPARVGGKRDETK